MKFCVSLLFAIALAPMAFPQVQLASGDYFPADLEFQEIQKIALEEVFEDPGQISELKEGRLFLDAGCDKYARRVYETDDAGSLSIEVAALADSRAAYSLLTLLGKSGVQDGPPGESFTSTADTILFAKGREWVRLKGRGVSEELMRRIANSVSGRIGSDEKGVPSLIAHLPRHGLDPESLRYFPGMTLYEEYAGSQARKYLTLDSEVEIAQARYTLEDRAGDLFLMNFPTPQAAEEYYEALPGLNSAQNSKSPLYAKKVGPMVAILEGGLDSASADRILSPLKFEYSIRWIYDQRNNTQVLWGVPTRILGTVVQSLLFVALLCLCSIAIGVGWAFFRFALRGHGFGGTPNEPEQAGIIKLRLR